MSTNHTPNYSLSQWQASDQVLRTDFNEDNAKIDAALSSLEERVSVMDKVFPDLIYHLGQVSAAMMIDRGKVVTQRLLSCDAFYDAISFTTTGGVVIANNRATLSGQGSIGTVSTNVRSADPEPWKEIRLWFHSQGGTVVPTINDEDMTLLYRHSDITALGDLGILQSYSWAGPYSSKSLKLTFELSCVQSSTTVLFDYCIAYL